MKKILTISSILVLFCFLTAWILNVIHIPFPYTYLFKGLGSADAAQEYYELVQSQDYKKAASYFHSSILEKEGIEAVESAIELGYKEIKAIPLKIEFESKKMSGDTAIIDLSIKEIEKDPDYWGYVYSKSQSLKLLKENEKWKIVF